MKYFSPSFVFVMISYLHQSSSFHSKYYPRNSAVTIGMVATNNFETKLDKPKWAGGGPISSLVNALISFKPLYNVMKVGARSVLIDTAQDNGVPWIDTADYLSKQTALLSTYFSELEDKSISYPFYYTQEFHAYDEGNLNWLAASECESVTFVVALRAYPKEKLTPVEALNKLRHSFSNELNSYRAQYCGSSSTKQIVEFGCSVGVSTFYIAQNFPEATVIDAIDLSPHFLSVAKYRQNIVLENIPISTDLDKKLWNHLNQFKSANLSRINWLHKLAENSGLDANKYDATLCCFMFHELPAVNVL